MFVKCFSYVEKFRGRAGDGKKEAKTQHVARSGQFSTRKTLRADYPLQPLP